MAEDSANPALLDALLRAIENNIIPMTRRGVAEGNKVFGAALLRKSDYSVFLAETNNEIENPLWHGEIHALKRFYEVPADQRPQSTDLIFLSTHEPCSMCLSAITWAGFDNFYYFFSHEDSRDSFAIPHDLRILKEVFALDPGGYRKKNEFWQGRSMHELIATTPVGDKEAFEARAAAIAREYVALSSGYQDSKTDNAIPLN